MTVVYIIVIALAIFATYRIADLLQTRPFTRYETISLAYIAGIIDAIAVVALLRLVGL